MGIIIKSLLISSFPSWSSLNADNLVRIGYAGALLGIAVTTMSFMDRNCYARAAGVLGSHTAQEGSIRPTGRVSRRQHCAAELAMGILTFYCKVFAFDTHHNTAALMLSTTPLSAALAKNLQGQH